MNSLTMDQLKAQKNTLDPTRLEDYLTNQAFQSSFGISRSEYGAMPKWKQANLKKKIGLY